MGYKLRITKNSWILASKRKRPFNQCSRVEDDTICTEATRKTKQRRINPNIQRQQDSSQICQQTRRNSFNYSARDRTTNTRHHPDEQHSIDLQTRTGNRKQNCRQIEQADNSIIRTTNATKLVQDDTEEVHRPKDRCIRSTPQLCSSPVLEPIPGPSSNSSRCLQADMAETRVVSEPSMEAHSKGVTQNQRGQSTVCSTSDTLLEDTNMVADDSPNDPGATYNLQEQPTDFNIMDRLEVISAYLKKQGLSEKAIDLLQSKNRQTSIRAYNECWKNWVK